MVMGDALIGATAAVLVALIGLVGVFVEATRRTNKTDHENSTLLLQTVLASLDALRDDVKDLTQRFNKHVDRD